MTASPVASAPARRALVVDESTRLKPRIVDRLGDWQYLERSVHRILAGWGRHVAAWDDKSALHRHVWDQAEVVRRLRERIAQFPGGKPDAPVSARLEEVANAVLLAPSLEDALDGVHLLLGQALVSAYVDYAQSAHPVHDAPTIAVLHEVNQLKAQQWLWYREHRRRVPHVTAAAYRGRVEALIDRCGRFAEALPVGDEGAARPAGVGTDFRLPRFSARDVPTRAKADFISYVRADFRTSLEARRLFWAFGYMMEKNLPDDQLAWLYYGHYLPWEWHHDVSRHLWDESRHGDSGLSRLRDWGIGIEEVGFPSYNNDEKTAVLEGLARGQVDTSKLAAYVDPAAVESMPMEPMSPKDLYEAVFFVGMVAENGHFIVKNEAYRDFQEGKDLESAEMMLFDIIDETAHVQYAHRWLPELARHAGIDCSDYRERAAKIRAELERGEAGKVAAMDLPRTPGHPDYDFYQDLLARIRAHQPLANAAHCPPRSPKPM